LRHRRLLAVLTASVSLALPASAQAEVPEAQATAACPAAASEPVAGELRKARKATLCLVNLERKAHGLRPLRENRRLRKAARRHSRAMVRRKFFDHVAPTGATLLKRVRSAGYLRGARSYTVGENIGWGGGHYATPLSMHRAWMRSPGHRENLLRPTFREIGIGIAAGVPVGGGSGATYTQNFGSRA
jgi:uncharacterized protein YkwD